MRHLGSVAAFAFVVATFVACSDGGEDGTSGAEVLPPGARDAGDDGGSESPSRGPRPDAGDSSPSGCAPVRRATFTSTVAVPLGCDAASPVTILDEPLPLDLAAPNSRVLGRARFRVRHVQSDVIHFWNLRVVLGDGSVSFGLGDDLCPGATQERGNLGLGTASATNTRAKLVGHAGAAPCTPGALVVDVGATLDVWVEDGRPECAGKDIAYGSHYLATGEGEKVRVLGVVEGSPSPNPNTICGAEVSTLVMQTSLDDAIVATEQDVVPASQGMGHLVLATRPSDANEVRTAGAGTHQARLLVGSNFVGPVATGGCCGDGAVALVRER